MTLNENGQEIDLDAALTVAMDIIKKASFRLDAITTKLSDCDRHEDASRVAARPQRGRNAPSRATRA